MLRNIPGTTNICPVLDVFVSGDQGLLCIDIEVSSPVHNTAWLRLSRGVGQWLVTSIVRIRTVS